MAGLAAALLVVLVALTPQAVALRITPHVALVGDVVFVRAHVDPRPENRLLRLDAVDPETGASAFGSSEFSLEGARSRRLYERRWVASDAGTFAVRATVYDAQGHVLAQARQLVVVAAN